MTSFSFPIKAFFALAIFGLAASTSSAHADVYYASFTNTQGTVSGTVDVEIFGLADNSTGAASSVVVYGYPSALNSIYAPGAIDTSTWDQQIENTFTVSGGVLTNADFWAQNTVAGFPQGSQLYLNGDSPFDFNFLNIDGKDLLYVYADDGIGPGALILNSGAPSATPEPSSLILLATGLAGAATSIRRRISK